MVGRRGVGVLVGLAALLAWPGAASVGARNLALDPSCGDVAHESARTDVGPGRPPLTIGDSVMLIAVEPLAEIGYEVNAQGCRSFEGGLRILRRRGASLPHLVVLALGSDSGIAMADIRHALNILASAPGGRRILGLVTPREHLLGGGGKHDREVVREAGRLYKNRVKVLDWVKFSAGHPRWFQPDGLHLTYAGSAAFTRLLARALPLATPGA